MVREGMRGGRMGEHGNTGGGEGCRKRGMRDQKKSHRRTAAAADTSPTRNNSPRK